MKNPRFLSFIAASLIAASLLTGCAGKGGKAAVRTEADEPAIAYVTAIANGKWDQVLKGSTGDQLAVYTQLVPALKQVKQTSELKRAEVVDRAINDNTAFVTVHYVRNVNLPDYGSVLDDKQVMLSMRKLDGNWKVFRMDVVTDIKTNLGK